MIDPELLPLLPTLSALLEEANVTRAAARLGISQPRMSARLAKVRRLIGDPLLVPAARGRGMAPTPRGLELRASVAKAMRALDDAMTPPEPFDPVQSSRRFHLIANDNSMAVVGAALVFQMHRAGACGMHLGVLPFEAVSLTSRLESGAADLVLASGALLSNEPALISRVLFNDRLRTAQRRGHPRGRSPLNIESFCRLDHVLVSSDGAVEGAVDHALARLGRKRRVAVSVPSYLLALQLVEHTDLVVTLPERLLRTRIGQLEMSEPPLDLPGFSLAAGWHPRVQADPANTWFRDRLIEAVKH